MLPSIIGYRFNDDNYDIHQYDYRGRLVQVTSPALLGDLADTSLWVPVPSTRFLSMPMMAHSGRMFPSLLTSQALSYLKTSFSKSFLLSSILSLSVYPGDLNNFPFLRQSCVSLFGSSSLSIFSGVVESSVFILCYVFTICL